MNPAGQILLLAGAVLMSIAALGMHRFDDVFARMHGGSKAASLAMVLIVTGGALRIGELGAAVLLVAAGAVALVTIPVGAHLLARAAYRSGDELSPRTVVDELGTTEEGDGGESGTGPRSPGVGTAPRPQA
jgi:multicomponent Na+:H+ antiporter subunit G